MTKSDLAEVVKVGDKTVVRRGDGEWKPLEEPEDDEDEDGARRRFAAARMFLNRPPHEMLSGIGSKLDKVKESEKKGRIGDVECSIFEAKFKESAAKDIVNEIVPMGGALEQMGDVEYSAKAKAWVDGDGRIVKIVIDGTCDISIQGMDISFLGTRTISFSGIDKTKVEIPEEAKEALK
ncbi:MAG: hypothetical protein HY716_08320 [Planctomycetes bacterium]|nr:hypothetical protein [Planctomycetota bacterium]